MKTTILSVLALVVLAGCDDGMAPIIGDDAATAADTAVPVCKVPDGVYYTQWARVSGDCPEGITGVSGLSIQNFADLCGAIGTGIPHAICPDDNPATSCAINELSCNAFVTVGCASGCSGEYKITLVGSQ